MERLGPLAARTLREPGLRENAGPPASLRASVSPRVMRLGPPAGRSSNLSPVIPA